MKKTILALVALLSAFASYGQLALPENVTASPSYLCPGSTATLSATVLSPNSIAWYTSPTGGTPFAATASGVTTSVSPMVTTTYYAETVSPSGSMIFSHTGNVQTWIVPAGVTQIMVDAKGASGASFSGSVTGGKGGRVTTLLNVTEGGTLSIYVGGQGAVGSGGFNGFSGTNGSTARRGGGATDIRIGGIATTNRVLVAGGGGASSSVANGGNGGNPATAGTNGPIVSGSTTSIGGGAATVSAGGAAGTGVAAGTAGTVAGLGGNGGTGNSTPAGNGGGGYFGGGGGGAHSINTNRSAGGGGGSSYVNPSYLSGTAVYAPGDNTGNGSVTITWVALTSPSRVPVTITLTTPPTSLNVTNITNSSATFSWTAAAGVNEYEWEVVASGAGSSATPIASGNVSNVTASITGLDLNTAYDAYVRSVCVSGGTSAWSAVRSFTTTVIYPPTVTLGTLQNPCNTTTKPTLVLKYTNPQHSPNLYSLSADIPDFTPVIEATLDGSGQILVDLTGTNPVGGNLYTVTITVKNSITQASSTYTKDVTFYNVPTNIPAYTSARRVFADVECFDGSRTHYLNTTTNELILSLTKGDWDPGTLVTSLTPVMGEYSVNVGFSDTTGYKLVNASYVTTAPSWYIMDKSFDVKTPIQPTSDVVVRYYYGDDMYNAVSGQLAAPIPNHDSLTIYKLKTGDSYTNLLNSHASVTAADVNFYHNSFSEQNFHFVTGVLDSNTSVHYLDYNVNHFSGGGGGSSSGGAAPTTGPGAFAVSFGAFSGYSTPTANELAWQTLSETNNDKFEVQASIDGKDFAKVGEVKSLATNGNSTKSLNYKFNDNMVSNHYYRLKQIDIDGDFNYSNIIEISASSTSVLYPNPAKDNLYLVYTKASKYSVQITNLAGQILMTLPTSEEGFRQIDVSAFPQGVYILRIFDGQNRAVENLKWTK